MKMKGTIFAISILLLVVSARADISSGLVGYWAFNESGGATANDSGGANNATLLGGAQFVTGMTGLGNALSLDGTDAQYVSIPTAAMAQVNQAASVSLWTNHVGAIRNMTIFWAANGQGRQISFHLPWSDGNVYFDTGSNPDFDRINKALTAYSDLEGKWNHWVFVKDSVAGTAKIYLNGALWHSGASLTRAINPVTVIYIGRGGGTGEASSGLLDDFRIYNRALSDSDIVELYNTRDTTATNPAPQSGAQLVLVGQSVSWSPPPTYTPTGYDVYFSTDANLPMGSKVLSAQNVTSYDPPGNMLFNKTYYWRVDAIDPNSGGNPILRTGYLWKFTTQTEKPAFTTQPKGALVNSGETGTFTVTVLSPYSVTYQWYKVGTPDTPVGTDSPSLGATDEGSYYCKATNSAGSTESTRASLTFKRLIGHWKFDGNANDATAYGNNGTLFNGAFFTAGIDGQAVSFDGMDDYVEIPAATFTQMTDQAVSVSMWINGGLPIPVVNSVLFAQDAARARVLNASMPYKETFAIIWDAGGSTGYDRISQSAVPSEHKGQWNHYMFTKDVATGAMNIYINGQPWLNGTGKSNTLGVPFKCVIGAALNSTGAITEPFPGLVDDVRIYNYALSAVESAYLYYDMTGKSACAVPVANDLSGDCRVNIEDFALIAQQWLLCNLIPQTACP